MWTYMMAASRGERSNMMLSASRRRNESESPKYGYNVGRSMQYRSTARHNVLPLHSTTSSTHPPSTYAYASSSTTTTTPYYESHHRSSINASDISTNLPSASTSAASTVSPPPFHTHAAAAGAASTLHRLPSYNSYHSNQTNHHNHQHHHHITHATASIDEDGTSLFSPLSPSTPLTSAVDDKDTHIFVYKGAKAKTTRKRLIANHVGEMMREEDVGGGGVATQRMMSMDESEVEENDDPVGLVNVATKRGRHYFHAAKTRDVVTESEMAASTCASGGGGGGAGRRRDNDDPGVASSGPDDDSVEEDYLELESGKRMSQDQTKRAKPSTLRRTLNALRQRLTRRSRSKPPDWFLEKFSNTNNVDKIGKITPATTTAAAAAASEEGASGPNATSTAPVDEGLSSEIRGTSRLCNRLSVNPTLQSHYRWLGIVSLAVLYNIIFVVGRSVFWEINQRAPTVWYFLDYLCDFIYLVDTLVHMHEGYLDQGLLVRDAYKLRRHYFHTKGWSIDVLSMLPTDLAYIWWPMNSCSSSMLPCPVIVRLNRLLRAPRLWEWFDRTETATGYPNAFRICKVVLAILVLIHWNACMYFAISYALGFGTDNWVYNLNGSRNATLQRQYIYSFYWSTLTLTTIGETPTPENDAEYLFVVADFLAGVLIFATIVGNIGSMISNMNVARVEFQNRMDGVKQYMAFRKVGNELEARVIRWFAYTWSQSGALDEERVLAALPDKLKAEIAIQVHMDTLKQVRIFHDCEPGLLEALVLKLKLQVFSPGDYICRKGDVGKEMYIVKRGKLSVVADDGVTVFATLGAGSVFGEVSVLEIAGNRTGNRRTANVRSLGYSDLFCLAKRDLWETLSDYPEARATLTERGCQLLRKDGLLDENVFADSQRAHDSIESGIEKLEMSVENLNVRLARLLAEYTASQAKLKQRLAKLEANQQLTNNSITGLEAGEPQTRPRSGRLYSLQPKKRVRPKRITTTTTTTATNDENKQNTL